MKKNSLSKDTIGGNLPAVSPVTRAMVHERTRELAVYELLGIDRPIPAITPHDRSLRTQIEALIKAFE